MNTPTKAKLSAQARFAQRQDSFDSYRLEKIKEREATLEKTARLRALRLAKEAADKAAAEAAPKPAAKKASTAARPGVKRARTSS